MELYQNIDLFLAQYEVGYYPLEPLRFKYIIHKKANKSKAVTSWIPVYKEISEGSLTVAHFHPDFTEAGSMQNTFFNTGFCLIIKHAMFFMNIKPGAKIIVSTSKTGLSRFAYLKSTFDFGFSMHHGPIHDIFKKIGFDIILEGFIPVRFGFFPETPLTKIDNPAQWNDMDLPYTG